MTFILTLALTFGLVLVALLLFWKLGSPFYRVEKSNVIALLELVVSGEATVADWEVFAAYPIRHDPELAEIQARCLEIAELEYLGSRDALFTRSGLAQLAKLLEELRAGAEV